MFKENRRRYFFIGFLALLFSLAFFMGQVQPVVAQENVTPTFTETPSPEITESPFVENSQTPSNTPEATSTLTPTPTLTNTLEALLEVPKIKGDYVEDEIIVRFAPSTGDAQAAASVCFVNEQVEISSEIAALGASLLKISSGSVAEAIARAENCPHILFAEPNYYLYAVDTVPNDPNWVNQYGLNNIRAPQGWDTTTGSASVVIAIVDTGVDLTHPDLASKIIAGYDFVNNDAVAQDDNGHGSHVAGIAAAASNNAAGVAGTSWGARIMPVKVLNASKSGTFANAAAGIIWAADNGAHIINLSLGGKSHSAIFQNAIDYAYGKGVVIIAASGNNDAACPVFCYPALYPNVIAVGATDAGNNIASFSNFGPALDLVAPGVNIYSTGVGSYFYDSGTSMSAPYVSGLAAILRGIPGSGSPANIA
ncbi:MAG: peptidase S8, partial [Chloroflexi bacterium]|nr:peptidase S8 [Chloroflexota bacterium]